MREQSLNLLAQLGGIDEQYIDEAGEDIPAKKKVHWLRWAALAACLAVVIVGGGILTGVIPGLPIGGVNPSAGGSGVDPAADGPSTFMSYAGPVFPLTLREENDAIMAERNVTLDFAPWIRTWWSNEDEANSRNGLTEEERQEVLARYNEWFPEGGRWQSSSDILVTDSYTLTNTSDQDQKLTVLYPFAGGLYNLGNVRPTLRLDGVALDTALHSGVGAAVSPEGGGDVLSHADCWEDYRDALADGTYLRNALKGCPDLSGTKVTVYEFTDPWGPEKDDEAGLPNPSILAAFHQDVEHSRVLSVGFNGGYYGWDTGEMKLEFSIPRPGERDYAFRLIVVGEDIQDLVTQGYASGGGWDGGDPIEAGVTVTRHEADLEEVLRQTAWDIYGNWDADFVPGVDFETYYGLLKSWLVTDGPLSDAGRYGGGALEENIVLAQARVFWLEAEVTVPAGGSVELTASMRKEASCDFYCAHTKNQGVYGYDLTTRLGSNLHCAAQAATLEDRGQIVIVRQNYGFDLENGVKTVPLTEEEYYLEVKRAPEG